MGEVKVAVGAGGSKDWQWLWKEDLGVEYGPANVEQLLPTLSPV